MASIGGVFPPAVTVVSGDEIDATATLRHMRRVVDAGVHGFCPGGSGGEFIAFSLEERRRIIGLGVEAAAGRVPVYAGTGCYSTRDTILLSRWAREQGAAGLMVVPPYYMQPTTADVVAHFRRLRQAVDLPIMLYHVSISGVELSLDMLAQLATEGTLAAAKLSQRDPSLARDLKLLVGDACAVFVGQDACAFEALCAGVDGWISGIPLVFPRLAVRLHGLIRDGQLAEARALWAKLTPFVRLEFGPHAGEAGPLHTIAVLKAALAELGDPVGDPVPPLQPLRGAALAAVRRVVRPLAALEEAFAREPAGV